MHMQHQTEAALLSYISQNIGYLGPVMNVKNISCFSFSMTGRRTRK